MPDAPGLELLLAEINQTHPGAVIDTSFDRQQPALIADPAQVTDVLAWLKETPGQEYGFLASLHGADYFPRAPRFAVHYELLNRKRYERLRVKVVLPDPAVEPPEPVAAAAPAEAAPAEEPGPTEADRHTAAGSTGFGVSVPGPASIAAAAAAAEKEPEPAEPEPAEPEADTGPRVTEFNGEMLPTVKSCVHLFPTAEFQEREVFDFFGVFFEGHPDLRRILMPEDFVGWPQRRDFPVGGEPVIFTRDEVENPGWWK